MNTATMRLSSGHATTCILLLAVSLFLSHAAAAESINAKLCETSSGHAIERTLSSAPTKELVKYVEGLNKGSYAFAWTISGHDAARQLGFGRRFAVTYGQAAEEVRARLAKAVCTLTRSSNISVEFSARNKPLIVS